MKNLVALILIIVFTAVNIYAEKSDINSLSEFQPYVISAKKMIKMSYHFKIKHAKKTHHGTDFFDNIDGINFDDDAMICDGFELKDMVKSTLGVRDTGLTYVAGSGTWNCEVSALFDSATVSCLTNQQKK